MKGQHEVRLLCGLLGVSRSGYYRWCNRAASKRAKTDARLREQIAAVHRETRGAYGAPRLVEELRGREVRISRRRCHRLMRDLAIRGKKKHRRSVRTTDSAHRQPVVPNLLTHSALPTGPNQIWVTDITYLRTVEGWLFLAAVMDLWSRRIVGWACASSLESSLAHEAMQKAIDGRADPNLASSITQTEAASMSNAPTWSA